MKHDHLVDFSELSDFSAQNVVNTAEKRDFMAQVKAAMAITGPNHSEEKNDYRSKEDKIEALGKIVDQGLEKLDSSQVMALFSAYRDLGAFDKMINLYKSTENEDFKQAPMVREQLAVAYRKVPRGKAVNDPQVSYAEILPDKMWDYNISMKICMDLIDEGYGNGVSYENIGKCLRAIANRTNNADKNIENKRKFELFSKSVDQLEKGFMLTLESSVGIQAVHGNMILDKKDRAKETAKVVYLAALRDGAEESNDYFCVSAALQAACITGESEKVINHLYNRLENSIHYKRELEEISQNMGHIAKMFPSEQTEKICQQLDALKQTAVPQKDENGKQTDVLVFTHDLNKDRHISEDPKLIALRNHSYSYRGCGSAFRGTNRVSGNMAFGGQLPDHTVSRKDLRLFTGLIKMTPQELGIEFKKDIPGVNMEKLMTSPLTEIKDPNLFMMVTDRFIRQTFTTENFAGSKLHMENNALDKNENDESVYDATVKSVLRACGKKIGIKDPNIDTRTNIAAIFALGMGDCRHHAQVKQIMFDMWQKHEMNVHLGNMYQQVKQGRQVDSKGPEAQNFYAILDTELRTADVEVRMPVFMEKTEKTTLDENGNKVICKDEKGQPIMVDKLYAPVKTQDGKYKVDPDQTHNFEEHTLCWLIKKDREGNLTEFAFRDAFYQDLHYDWGNKKIDLKDIQVDHEGKPKIPAGRIEGDKTSTGKPIEIVQVPTSYNSGKRDTVVSNSIGRDVCLVGIPLKGFATPKDFLKMIKDRQGMALVMQKILFKDPETKGFKPWKVPTKPKAKKAFLHQGISKFEKQPEAKQTLKNAQFVSIVAGKVDVKGM